MVRKVLCALVIFVLETRNEGIHLHIHYVIIDVNEYKHSYPNFYHALQNML